MGPEDGVRTPRLRLIPLPLELLRAAADDREGLAAALATRIPGDWPQADLVEALPFFQQTLAADPAHYSWLVWVMIRVADPVVVGDIGFRGPPKEGIVEIGYSVLPAFRSQGIAGEAVAALVAWLQGQPEVHMLIAHTEPDNLISQRVLRRIGMAEHGMEDGEIRWELPIRPIG